jgi:hypothetical protein
VPWNKDKLVGPKPPNQPEWVQRFGAKMRTEHAPRVNESLPEAIVAKLQAIADAECSCTRSLKPRGFPQSDLKR